MPTSHHHTEACSQLAHEYEKSAKAVGRAKDALKRRQARERALLRRWRALHPERTKSPRL